MLSIGLEVKENEEKEKSLPFMIKLSLFFMLRNLTRSK